MLIIEPIDESILGQSSLRCKELQQRRINLLTNDFLSPTAEDFIYEANNIGLKHFKCSPFLQSEKMWREQRQQQRQQIYQQQQQQHQHQRNNKNNSNDNHNSNNNDINNDSNSNSNDNHNSNNNDNSNDINATTSEAAFVRDKFWQHFCGFSVSTSSATTTTTTTMKTTFRAVDETRKEVLK